jgi:hypothetical protein
MKKVLLVMAALLLAPLGAQADLTGLGIGLGAAADAWRASAANSRAEAAQRQQTELLRQQTELLRQQAEYQRQQTEMLLREQARQQQPYDHARAQREQHARESEALQQRLDAASARWGVGDAARQVSASGAGMGATRRTGGLPAGWVDVEPPGAMASNPNLVQYAENVARTSGVAISEAPRSGVADMVSFVAAKRLGLKAALLDARAESIRAVTVSGRPAWVFEVAGRLKHPNNPGETLPINWRYLCIDGPGGITTVAVWSAGAAGVADPQQFVGM